MNISPARKRRICVVTGSRAEYGLLRWVLEGIRESPALELQLVVTGTHLVPAHGLTYREIEKDGFKIDRKVDMQLESDTPVALIRSMGLELGGFGGAIEELRPDLMFVLGDRFEILPAVTAATVARIPVAHAHGGESSEGAFDEAFRHAITKMSHLHFVAAEPYGRRVIQLGEDPQRVYLVGGLGLDNMCRLKLLERGELENVLGFALGAKSLLITFHPATLETVEPGRQLEELLAALDAERDTQLVFTMPNADPDSQVIVEMVREFVAGRNNAHAFTSMGQLLYLSCMRQVDGVVGNSSSGLIEAPGFRKGTINIGDRQRGRLKASSVIDCKPAREEIRGALARLHSPEFQKSLETVVNPYGDGGASEKIVDVLESVSLGDLLKKRFYDLPN